MIQQSNVSVNPSSVKRKTALLSILYDTEYKHLANFVVLVATNEKMRNCSDLLNKFGLPAGAKLIQLATQLPILTSIFESTELYSGVDYRLAAYSLIQLLEPSFVSVVSNLSIAKSIVERIKVYSDKLARSDRPPGVQGLAALYCVEYSKNPTGIFDHAGRIAELAEKKALK